MEDDDLNLMNQDPWFQLNQKITTKNFVVVREGNEIEIMVKVLNWGGPSTLLLTLEQACSFPKHGLEKNQPGGQKRAQEQQILYDLQGMQRVETRKLSAFRNSYGMWVNKTRYGLLKLFFRPHPHPG